MSHSGRLRELSAARHLGVCHERTDRGIYAISPVGDAHGYLTLEENLPEQRAPIFVPPGETKRLRVTEVNEIPEGSVLLQVGASP